MLSIFPRFAYYSFCFLLLCALWCMTGLVGGWVAAAMMGGYLCMWWMGPGGVGAMEMEMACIVVFTYGLCVFTKCIMCLARAGKKNPPPPTQVATGEKRQRTPAAT